MKMTQISTRMLNLSKDEGFAWCILVMSFLSYTVHVGFLFSVLGTATIAHKALLGLDTQQSSLIGTVQVGLFYFLAPLASIMLKKIGCRVTQLVGGASLVLGLGLSALTKELWHSYILFSVLPGWGFVCCYMASSEILSLSFEKYRFLAFALAMLGSFIGMTVWPIASQKLFDVYGYHKAMGIMASFHIVHIIAGVLYFEPENNKGEEKGNESKNIEEPEMVSTKNDLKLESGNEEPTKGLLESLKLLLKTPKAWLLICNCLLWAFNLNSYLILVNDYIVQMLSISADEAALGTTISGIGSIVGACLTTAISRRDFDRIILHVCCSLVYGTCTMVIGASASKSMFYALAAIWGLANGVHFANLLAVVHGISSSELFSLQFGANLFAECISSLGAAPLCSYVASYLGSIYGFILSGSTGIMASMVLLPVIIHNHRCRLNPRESNAPPTDAAVDNKGYSSSSLESYTDDITPSP